ncbi:MAG: hypothetical protein JSS23_12255 [Proteobacteria bacterium]|nr:hypothetical protein [Pseudomonadota bacterium]
MSRELAKLVLEDLADRKAGWEGKQRVFYEMRHQGVRRKSKPFPEAADLHYPLGDGIIDKLKPFYFAQVFGNEMLATFAAESTQADALTRGAAAVFDDHLKEKTNFFEEINAAIDNMTMAGGAPIKCWYDVAAERLEFDAIDPIFLVVPPGTKDLQRATRVTHIIQMSVEEYRLDDRYNQDEETIRRIKGKGTSENDSGGKLEAKYSREGLTHGQDNDQIVLWETYVRTKDGIRVTTFSPVAPDIEIRKSFMLIAEAYPEIPIYQFKMEIKDKGYYAPRGVMERIGPHEAYLSRLWNEKADSMTFLNKPIFTHDGSALNLQNIRLVPGQIVPNNLRKVDMGTTPFDFDAEMNGTRLTAEYQIGMPDFGTGQRLNTKERKTATEVAQIANVMGQSNDLRAWIFRRDLAKLYRCAWRLLVHFAKSDLRQWVSESGAESVDAAALAAQYRIQPSGTADGWNRPLRAMRAEQRYNSLKGDPAINQPELTRHRLEEDDPRLVRTLWQDPGTAQEDQIEDQADEIGTLLLGFPARVKPVDVHPLHIQTIMGYVQAQLAMQRPIDPLGLQKLAEHVQKHLQAFHQQDARAANELGKQVEALMAPLMQQVQAMQQQQQAQVAQAQPGGPMGMAA